ncbi:hypothetical protein KAR91_33065 [Candidatus Pacearchaeota archaeon]|nr:hypothetical protein [Candidatus Pacearchaeota archaeon]
MPITILNGAIQPEPGNIVGGFYFANKVNLYANLPAPAINYDGQMWYVRTSTGFKWGERKGWYESISGVWERSSNQTMQVLDNEGIFVDNVDNTKKVVIPAQRMLTGETGTVKLDTAQTITVAISGAMYTDPKTAIEGISDSSILKPYVVEIYAGNYTISNPIAVPDYVTVKGIGNVLLLADTPANNMFNITGTCFIEGIAVRNATSGIAFNIDSTGNVVLTGITIIDCDKGIVASGTGLTLTVRGITLLTIADTITTGISVDEGNVVLSDIVVGSNSTVATIIDCSVAATVLTIDTLRSFSPNVTTGIKIATSRVSIHNVNIVGIYDALVCEDGCNVLVNALNVFNAQNDGFRIEDVGADTQVQFQSSTVLDSTGFDLNLLSATCIISGGGRTSIDKLNFVSGARLYGSIVDLKEGDEGFNILGELHVGHSLFPTESVLGAGDSHTFEYVYSFDGTATYTDRTAAAISFSGSTFQFDGVTAGNAIYIANRFPITFEGVKIALASAGVSNYGDIVAEYWNGAWTEFNGCTVKADKPFYKYRKDYFAQSGSYHLKYNPFIIDDWVVNDPPSLGDDYYWMRFRIDTAITTSPVIQQIKIHTDRTEINIDGTIESHAGARTYKKLVVDAVRPLEGNMQNGSIYVDENVGVGLDNNRFTTTGDLLGVSFELPEDCDTSAPLIFVWKGKFAAAGTVEFTVRRKIVQPGDAYTNAEPAASGDTLTILTGNVVIGAGDVREDLRVDIDISDAIPSRDAGFGDEIWITLQLSTRGAAGNFDYTKLSANYLSDFNGRHVRQ